MAGGQSSRLWFLPFYWNLFFLQSGSLLIVVILHAGIDLISGMVGVLGQAEQPSDEI